MRQPSLARRLLPVLIGLGAVAVIVVVLLIITRSGTTSTPLAHSAKTSVRARHHVARPIAFNPATVTVAVLNGTAVTNLAHDVGLRLAGSGYKEGTLATAADQTHTTTIVEYLPGHQLDAREVAAALKLKPSAVQPADPQSLGVACPGTPAACQADVIVTVGTDLASAAQTTTG